MLNGVDPLLIINLYNYGILDILNPASELGDPSHAIPIPIVLYLSERVTGIYVDSETRGIDVETKIDPTTAKDPTTLEVLPPVVSQTSSDSQVTVNLLATTDCILLTAILALMDMIVARLVTAEYSIHYINGATCIFGAKLHRFSTSVSRNDNLVRIELTLSTAAKETPTPKTPVESIAKFQGAIPL